MATIYEQLVDFFENEPVEIAGENRYETARDWVATGMDFEVCVDYVSCGCWCPQSALILANEGILPRQLDRKDEDGRTLGLAYAASIISLEALKRAIV